MRLRTRQLLAAAAATLLAGTLIQPGIQAAAESAAAERSPAHFRVVRAQVFTVPGVGTVAVGMPTARRVMVQHRDPATGSWSPPALLFDSGRRRTCGEIDGIASPGGLALTIECDASYSDDQAPAKSQALVTRNLETWAGHQIPGESYRPPGISPGGEYAVWAAHGGSDVYTWSADTGFDSSLRPVGHDFDTGDLAFVVDAAGTVTVAGPDSAHNRCVVGLYSRTLAGATTREQVDIAPGRRIGCTELAAYGESSTRITSGPFVDRPGRWVIGRADESSPWGLVERVPVEAPGLQAYRGSLGRVMNALYSDVPGQPLLALGSPDRRRVTVQAYDAEAQAWGPTRLVYDHGFPGCAWGQDLSSRTYAVHSVLMHCYPKRRASGVYPPRDDNFDLAPANATRALLSIDGSTWRAVPMGGKPVTASLDRTLIAAGRAHRTTIASPEGFTEVAAGAPGRCEAVVPIGPSALLRLDATRRSNGYPSRLQQLTPSGWRTLHRIPPLGPAPCRRVEVLDFGVVGRFHFVASRRTKGIVIKQTADGWRAVVVRGL